MSKNKSITKEIKKEIFSNDPNYDIIYDYLGVNYDEGVGAVLNSLLNIFRHMDNINNKEIAGNLIILLSNFVKKHKNKNTLENIYNKIDVFLSNLSHSFNWKEFMNIEKYISSLVNIQNKCLISSNQKGKGDRYNFIMYLVFKKRDVDLLGKYMINNMKELLISSSTLPSVFANIIEKYINIDEENIYEIKYFNEVLYLFLRGKLGDKLLSNKDYLEILKSSDKSFVWDLIYKIENNFVMSKEEIAREYNVSFHFPKLEKYEYHEGNRVDFTNQKILTIDNQNDTCLDDALYIEKNIDGTYTLYIHVSDVPSIIPYESPTMQEALRRCKTIYLPGEESIPIFEDYLSSGILSILPGKKTNVLTFIINVDTDYSLILDTLKVVPGVVINKNKLSYEEVDDLINNGNNDLSEILRELSDVSKRLSRDNLRIKSFHKYDNIIKNKNYTHSSKSDTSSSHLIVEHTMVLSGRLLPILSKYHNLNIPFQYRIHPECNDEFTRKVLEDIDNIDPNSTVFKRIARDYMPKSSYSEKNIGHFGLGIDAYVRVGSGARRASDDINIYSFYDFYLNKNKEDLDCKYYFWEKEIKYWSDYFNNKASDNNSFASQYDYLKRNGKILEKK